MTKQKNKRTDLLVGPEAELFARKNIALYVIGDMESANTNSMIGFYKVPIGLMKGVSGEYFMVKLSESKTDIHVDEIKTEPVTLFYDEEAGQQPKDAFIVKGWGFDVDVIDKKTGMPTRLYVNRDFIVFQTPGDRDAFEKFANEVYNPNAKFDTLKKVRKYFVDENVVRAAKERVRSDLYDTEFDGGLLGTKRLYLRATHAIDQTAKAKSFGE